MQSFQKILFPIDMSDSCTAAVPFVEAVARKYQASVTLIHAVEMPAPYITDWQGYVEYIDTKAILEARINEVDSYLKDRFQGLQVSRVVREGDPARLITGFAEEQGMDLIMMPTHGYGIFRSMLLGSVTAKVLHDAKCPVWTGVHVEDAPIPKSTCNTIMCAVDLTDASIATIRFASGVARDFGAKFYLVHAIPGAAARPEKYFEADLQAFLEEEARKAIGKMQETAGVRAPICFGTGDVADVVREAAIHHEGDLIVVGRGHVTRTLGRLRTNVYSIIREAPCPVISA